MDYVEHLNRSKTIANPSIINFEAETPESHESHMSLELAMQWNTTYNESVHTFANTINTHEGAPTRRASAHRSPPWSTPGARSGA